MSVLVEMATKKAVQVPYSVLEKLPVVLDLVEELVEKGNSNSLSDVGVAALTSGSSASGAYMNVIINLSGLSDKLFIDEYMQNGKKLNKNIQEIPRLK